MTIAVSITLTLAANAIHVEAPKASPQTRHKPDKPGCQDARRAIVWYRARYNEHRAVMGASPAPALEQHMGCRRVRERAAYWIQAASSNRVAAVRWRAREYGWTAWMPRGSKEYRVASCETGYGRDPNFAHDSGTYVSAWGIYRPAYADDAHRVGNLSWDETIRRLGRIPTPREQWEAMRSHRAAHGDWSGWGCRGA